MNLLSASCRLAFAALIHDMGKFAQRANLPISTENKETLQQLFCPRHDISANKSYWSHTHAAYTAVAYDAIESCIPELLNGDQFPFNRDDSLINVSANHHKPETLLQWIIATADRVSSGFERQFFDEYNKHKEPENHYRARLRSLLEQVHLPFNENIGPKTLSRVYPLEALTAKSLFTVRDTLGEPQSDDVAQKEYAQLWKQFCHALSQIGAKQKSDWHLWLDHFDSAWLTFTSNIPSATAFGVLPDVSLYDHS